ncbi:unnamed protein product [Pleuronectes platessa]|uniref:Uncharacterized protein n=1 Tax=Pleuronectes platessa TaxID=8262 RepID=A0A9N7VWH3_PLEPL|nr:unnamed protein product [Pleuronectes platessa]
MPGHDGHAGSGGRRWMKRSSLLRGADTELKGSAAPLQRPDAPQWQTGGIADSAEDKSKFECAPGEPRLSSPQITQVLFALGGAREERRKEDGREKGDAGQRWDTVDQAA